MPAASPDESQSWSILLHEITSSSQVKLFFVYLILLLSAILGQDVLLEPYAAEAFDMPVNATTRITALWGICFLVALVVAGWLEKRGIAKRSVAKVGGWGAVIAFILIAVSGVFQISGVFYSGVMLLGLATGLATVSNLSLMLDMTVPGKVGLYIGAWGMANAIARLMGSVFSGLVRDLIDRWAQNPVAGYVAVFLLMAITLIASLMLLQSIDVSVFRKQVVETPIIERAAIANEG
jgi:BCD family chlorophyll transporter-like MFS transporter